MTLDCTQAAKRGTALLSWTPGPDNSAAIIDVQIEYVVGFNRPTVTKTAAAILSPSNTMDALEALNASIRSGEWRTLKHRLVRPSHSPFAWQTDDDSAAVNLTSGTALVPIYPDVAYQLRVRLINKIGISEPGPIAPGLNEDEQKRCLLKPQVPTIRPDEVKIYGNVPNTLTVAWKVDFFC